LVKTISQLYLETRRRFMEQEDEQTAGFLTRNLLCHVTGKTPEQIIAQREMYVSKEVSNDLETLVQRVLSGEPLAYVLGEWDFHGLKLTVNPDVLIPRDDTCAVTDMAIRQALLLNDTP